MRILVSGATGLVGNAFAQRARSQGHAVVTLTRSPRSDSDIGWDPSAQQIDSSQLEGFHAVVHLAGENIAAGRWNAERKRRIRDSRVQGTRFLCETLANLQNKPDVLVSASAIGYYGDRGDTWLNEESSAGSLFLSQVCQEWESATAAAKSAGIRTVHARFGIILSTDGGALAKMLLPFKLGAGGVVGSGRQYWSWISLDDTAGALMHLLESPELREAVNIVSPHPVTNQEFTAALGRVLRRPTIIPMPAFAARLALGEMADELLLASARVKCQKLNDSQYGFEFAELTDALRHLLAK